MHLDFKPNLSLVDRIVRVGLSLLIAVPVATGALKGGWAVAAVIVALFLFTESALGY